MEMEEVDDNYIVFDLITIKPTEVEPNLDEFLDYLFDDYILLYFILMI